MSDQTTNHSCCAPIEESGDNTNQYVVEKSHSTRSKHWVSGALLILMILGFVVIGNVFWNNRQALPVNIGAVVVDPKTSTNEQPVVADTSDVAAAPEVNLTTNTTDLETDPAGDSDLQGDTIEATTRNTVTLVGVSTDRAKEIIPPIALNYDPETAIDVPTWDIEIPNSESPVTMLLAGATACPSCALEAKIMQQIVNELDNPNLEVIFVDLYPYGGAENLAWFAGTMDATDLTWAMDQDNNFMNTYQVALNSTLIIDSTGTILYRDDTLSPPELLREQIDLALSQTS